MKKLVIICSFLLGVFLCPVPTFAADKVISVKYVFDKIQQIHNINTPIESGFTPTQVVSMKYLFRQIDRANFIANGIATTNYAATPLANRDIATEVLSADDITTLIQKNAAFEIDVHGTYEFSFDMAAAGSFIISWGDGTVEHIDKPYAENSWHYHNFPDMGSYTIRIMGLATDYNMDYGTAVISFAGSMNKTAVNSIRGSLGKIFPTLDGGNVQPRFNGTFSGLTGLGGTEIPANLFEGIYGQPVDGMFDKTFYNSGWWTGGIPDTLFAGLSGVPVENMFRGTFAECNGIEYIPDNLFAGISGAPATGMFESTFTGSSISGQIPNNLFAGISGTPAPRMFWATFYNCSGLTGFIPTGLFGAFSGSAAEEMFNATFLGCIGLTGIADGIWDVSGVTDADMVVDAFTFTFHGCSGLTTASPNVAPGSLQKLWDIFGTTLSTSAFRGATNLTDWASIPISWKN